MSVQKKIRQRRVRRAFRVRNQARPFSPKPRVTVFRSLKHIYAQIIDDTHGTTLASFSSPQLSEATGDKKAVAKKVGQELGARAREHSVTKAYFDRGPYKYHGRVASLVDGLRESGLEI